MLKIEGQEIEYTEVLDILRQQNIFRNLLEELVLEKKLLNIEITKEREDKLVKTFREENNLKDDEAFKEYMKRNYIEERHVRKLVTRAERIVEFRTEEWAHLTNSLYLQNKDKYDLITYRRLECNNQDIMQEVYFRIKDGEETWETMAKQFAPGNPEANAKIGPVPKSIIEQQLMKSMKDKGEGRIVPPIHVGNSNYAIAELIKLEASVYNEEIQTQLIKDSFNEWIANQVQKSSEQLTFN